MPYVEIRPEARNVMRALAETQASAYVETQLIPSLRRVTGANAGTPEILDDPFLCLKAIYGHYAFTRRGKDRHELADLALAALERTRGEDFEQFLAESNADRLWANYLDICAERKKKPQEQLNLGPVAGIAELAQEVYRRDGVGSIAGWVHSGVAQTDRLEPQFLRMVDVRGVGPKLTSLFLRDVVFFFNLEERIDHSERLYVQPVDKWIRMIAPYVIDEPGIEDAADWILAGKLAKHTRHARISGVRFNMGATYFGMREIRSPEQLPHLLDSLTQ